MIETLVLRALAFQVRSDLDQAMGALEKAVLLAQPDRYQRIFLDEGEPMAKLFYQSGCTRPGHVYAGELFQAFSSTLPARKLLTEPLTERELQVFSGSKPGAPTRKLPLNSSFLFQR